MGPWWQSLAEQSIAVIPSILKVWLAVLTADISEGRLRMRIPISNLKSQKNYSTRNAAYFFLVFQCAEVISFTTFMISPLTASPKFWKTLNNWSWKRINIFYPFFGQIFALWAGLMSWSAANYSAAHTLNLIPKMWTWRPKSVIQSRYIINIIWCSEVLYKITSS